MLLPQGEYLVAGDVCHAYLTDRRSAGWIHEVFPEAKIIMLLRNPADKAFAQYNWLVSHGYEYFETFEEALRAEEDRYRKNVWKVKGLTQEYRPNYLYFRSGLYAEQVNRYLKCFPRENILFLKFEDFGRNTKDEMKRIYNFLGVTPPHAFEYERYNAKKKVRSARRQYFLRSKLSKVLPMKLVNLLLDCNSIKGMSFDYSPETRNNLLRQYRKDILKTQEITGLNLQEWLA